MNNRLSERSALPKTPFFDKSLQFTMENLKKTLDRIMLNTHNADFEGEKFFNYLDETTFEKHVLFLGGAQIAGSLSPFMHTYSGFCAGEKLLYVLGDFHGIKNERDTFFEILLNNISLVGANVTMPYKEDVFESLQKIGKLDDSALLAGAVNTIVKKMGILLVLIRILTVLSFQ